MLLIGLSSVHFLPFPSSATFPCWTQIALSGRGRQMWRSAATRWAKPPLSHFKNPHSDGANYCSGPGMMVIVQMNVLMARAMAAAGWDNERADDSTEVKGSTADIAMVSGGRRGVRVGGDRWRRRDERNHIKWNECDWTPEVVISTWTSNWSWITSPRREKEPKMRQEISHRGCLEVSVDGLKI